MSLLSIKIKIADRDYPMKVEQHEEEQLRLAGKLVNERLREFQKSFGIDDKQDLLAMVVFDTMVEKIKVEGGNSKESHDISERLQRLNQLVEKLI